MNGRVVDSLRDSNVRTGTARLLPALLVLASVASALITNVGIDVLGDYLLPRDAYDYVAHGSRGLGALVAGLCLLLTFVIGLRAALRDARGDEGAFLALLKRAVPRNALVMWASVAGSALAVTALMQACDAFVAGRPCDDVGDLLGGSVPLAFAVATVVSAAVCGLVRAVVDRFCAMHRAIVSLVELFTRLRTCWYTVAFFSRRNDRRSARPAVALGCDADGRAPPAHLSLALTHLS